MLRTKLLPAVMLLMVVFLPASGCFGEDVGCETDAQCRPGRSCVDHRCAFDGTQPGPMSQADECSTDEQCDSDSLCRDGRCDEFQCRNADGTDTSPDCECNTFERTTLEDGGCSFEEHCFSGNLLIECTPNAAGDTTCRCYEALREVMSFAAEAHCDGERSDAELYALCEWDLP